MRHLLAATAAGLFVLVFTASAPAQQYGGYFNAPNVQRYGYVQPGCAPNTYVQPQYGGSFNYGSPNLSFGLGYNSSYGSNYAYPQSTYLPSYNSNYSVSPWANQYHPHHHHYGHR